MTERTLGKTRMHPDWGGWTCNGVEFIHRPSGYPIDIDRCTTSAELLDWLMQVAKKTWANDATLAGLCRAFNDVLRPQATLCSGGVEVGPVRWVDDDGSAS